MGLQQQLEEQKKSTVNKASPETIQTMLQATAELKASGIENRALTAGDRAPAFRLPNANGETIRLTDLLDRGPVVLNFYRGGWCPYCNLELAALQAELPNIQALGASLIAITPEQPDRATETSTRHQLEFEVLSDRGNRVARQFGLVFTLPESIRAIYASFGTDLPAYNGDDRFELPLPATYVIRPDATISYGFVDADYTRRMEPADIIQALGDL